MTTRGFDVGRLAELTGKRVDHIRAVLDGYPNTKQRPTQLDTVDEIAETLGFELGLKPKN
jgi:hypothetical protein